MCVCLCAGGNGLRTDPREVGFKQSGTVEDCWRLAGAGAVLRVGVWDRSASPCHGITRWLVTVWDRLPRACAVPWPLRPQNAAVPHWRAPACLKPKRTAYEVGAAVQDDPCVLRLLPAGGLGNKLQCGMGGGGPCKLNQSDAHDYGVGGYEGRTVVQKKLDTRHRTSAMVGNRSTAVVSEKLKGIQQPMLMVLVRREQEGRQLTTYNLSFAFCHYSEPHMFRLHAQFRRQVTNLCEFACECSFLCAGPMAPVNYFSLRFFLFDRIRLLPLRLWTGWRGRFLWHA